jgi:hypothetical protein
MAWAGILVEIAAHSEEAVVQINLVLFQGNSHRIPNFNALRVGDASKIRAAPH